MSVWSRLIHNTAAMALVGVLVGSLATGVFLMLNSWLTFWREEQRRQKRERREALREINLGLEHYNMSMQALYPGAMDAFLHQKKADFSYLPKGGKSLFDIHFQIGVYAPELAPEFKNILGLTEKYNLDWLRVIAKSAIGQKDYAAAAALGESLRTLGAAIHGFRDHLIEYACKNCFGRAPPKKDQFQGGSSVTAAQSLLAEIVAEHASGQVQSSTPGPDSMSTPGPEKPGPSQGG